VETGSTEWEDFKKFKTPKAQELEDRVRKTPSSSSSSPQGIPSTKSSPGLGRGGPGRQQPRKFAQRRGKDGWKNKGTPGQKGSSPGGSGLEGAWYTRPDQDRDEGKSFNKVTPKENGDGEDSKKGKSNTVKIFGSFWVGKEDAERLQKMAKRLKDEGLPRKDILSMLQGERRKAEKAAKRQRDKTCFKCRRFGHVLAECPNNSNNGTNTSDGGVGDALVAGSDGDICFKCGSTEHSSRNCKRKGEKFSYATCFVCRETGHIARQCPKNTKGVYPGGGSCDECGAITHLKKDCPEAKNGGGDSGNDADVVVGRIENPFVSAEIEPAVAMELDDEETATTEDAGESYPLKSKPKRNLKRRRIEEELPNPFNAETDSIPKKKRKVDNNNADNKAQGDKVESINIANAILPPKKKKKRVVKF